MGRLIACLKCGRPQGKATCDACSKPIEQAQARERERARPTPSQRGYGHAWRVVRAEVLARDHHQCQDCATGGSPDNPLTCDHIIAKSRGGTDELPNLITRCKRCHGHKTAADQHNAMVEWS